MGQARSLEVLELELELKTAVELEELATAPWQHTPVSEQTSTVLSGVHS